MKGGIPKIMSSSKELAVFDILTRPGPELDAKETEAIKKVCNVPQ